MIHGLVSQLIDEVAANVLLHRFLTAPGGIPERGPGVDVLPGLYSGALSSFYAPFPMPVDLTARRRLVDENGGQRVWDCCFASETTTIWPENNEVWCRHWQSKQDDRGLTVVGVDGLVQLGMGWFRRLAVKLVPMGIDVVMMDAPCNHRRTPARYRPGQLIIAGDLAHQLAITRQAVLDLCRVIVSLQSQGRRVGLVGVSYGGWVTLLTSLVAPTIEFLVALVPPVDLVRMLRESTTVVRGIRRGLGRAPLDAAELERIARPVVPSNWPAPLPGDRIVLHAARFDRLVPWKGIERLSQKWNTRLVMHSEAHFRLAMSGTSTSQVAEQVLAFAT